MSTNQAFMFFPVHKPNLQCKQPPYGKFLFKRFIRPRTGTAAVPPHPGRRRPVLTQKCGGKPSTNKQRTSFIKYAQPY